MIYNLKTLIQKMNVDPEDSWLAIGAGVSIFVFGICVCGTMLRCYCRRTRMKESRSGGDLSALAPSMEEEDDSSSVTTA